MLLFSMKFESLVLCPRYLEAFLSKLRRRARTSSYGAHLLARHVLVHPCHPRIDLIAEEVFPQTVHMISPLLNLLPVSPDRATAVDRVRGRETNTLLFRLNVIDIPVSTELNTFRNPPHSKPDAARDVSVRLVGTHGHEHVGEVLYGEAQIRPGSCFPFFPQAMTVHAAEVYRIKGARHYVRVGCRQQPVQQALG